jgi:hypothetical protein
VGSTVNVGPKVSGSGDNEGITRGSSRVHLGKCAGAWVGEEGGPMKALTGELALPALAYSPGAGFENVDFGHCRVVGKFGNQITNHRNRPAGKSRFSFSDVKSSA